METELLGIGATPAQAKALCELFSTYTQARPYVAPPSRGGNGFKALWSEYYSLKYNRQVAR